MVKAISNEFMCRARQWRDVADFEQSGINYSLSLNIYGSFSFGPIRFLLVPNRPDCNPSLNFRRAILDNPCIENFLANFLNAVNGH